MEEFTKKQIEISIRKFEDYSNDLMDSNNSNFDNELKIWLNHCENDDVMKIIIKNLENKELYEKIDPTVLTGRGGMIGSSHINLPIDEYERDAFIYNKLKNIDSNSVFNLMLRCRGGGNLDNCIYEFNQLFVAKLIRSLNYKMEEMLDKIESEIPEGQKVSENLLIIFQDNSINIGKKTKIKGNVAIGTRSEVKK